MTDIRHRPEIDGLRAFAIIPVILFHMGFPWMPGGFIGVDVFFVISGFLITSIIVKQEAQGTFSFRDFWGRRIRRILPAMLLVTAATLVAALALSFRLDQLVFAKAGLSALFSVANVYHWRYGGNYWGASVEESPFLHAWSLSVEEQFYLIYPVVLWLMYRYCRRWLPAIVAAATIASLVLFMVGVRMEPVATFYLLPFRAWELGVGCLLAITPPGVLERPNRIVSGRYLALTGLTIILASYVFIKGIGAAMVTPVVGTALILAYGREGPCHSLLSRKAVTYTGLVSYSLYLWHWPVLVFARQCGMPRHGLALNACLFALMYALAAASYQFVENPTRRRPGAVPVILGTAALVAVATAWMAFVPRYYDTSAFDAAYYRVHNCNPKKPRYDGNHQVFGTTVIENDDWTPDAYRTEGIRVGDASVTPAVMLLGDSHGCMWSQAVRQVIEELGISGSFFCIDGTNPFMHVPLTGKARGYGLSRKKRLEFDRAKLNCIERWKPAVVIIAANWRGTDEGEAASLIRFISGHGAKIILIEDPPTLLSGERNIMQLLASRRVIPDQETRLSFPCLDDNSGGPLMWSLAASNPGVEILPTRDLYTTDTGALVLEGRSVLYLDNDHLVSYGAEKIIPRLRETLREILVAGPSGDGVGSRDRGTAMQETPPSP